MAIKVECIQCNKTFHTWPSKIKQGKGKFCSTKCRYESQKYMYSPICVGCGKITSSYQTKWCASCKQKGEKNHMYGKFSHLHHNYKVDGGYYSTHRWVYRNLNETNYCQLCGSSDRKLEWANLSDKYLRKSEDWLFVCRKCHFKLDKKKRNILNLARNRKDYFNRWENRWMERSVI